MAVQSAVEVGKKPLVADVRQVEPGDRDAGDGIDGVRDGADAVERVGYDDLVDRLVGAVEIVGPAARAAGGDQAQLMMAIRGPGD